jgi:rubrerythrin
MSRYIDLDKAIPIAIQAVVDVVGHGISQVDAVRIAERFEDAPTADAVEVRHGHWIEHTAKPDWLEDDVEVFYNCSECGSSHWSIIPPYCPNCGAKMDGERREE